ncbi:MAG: hypothetical protein LH629_11445, partial [Ignavibacteria bacterium]|nr:hypothetical protein [Ignavibacteria bacterium]
NMLKLIKILLILFLLFVKNNLQAQNIGDWGSVLSGKISEINKFKIWNGTSFNINASGNIPSTANLYLNNDIILDQDFTCKNLIIVSNKTSFGNQIVTIDVTGNVEVRLGASFDMSNASGNKVHQINLKGNITVASGATLDMSKTSNSTDNVCNITFNDETKDQFITSSGSIQLNSVTVIKTMGTKKVVCNPNPNLIGIITITSGAWEQYAGQAKFLTASNWTIPTNGAVYIKGTAFINHFFSNTITVSGILSLESSVTSTFSSMLLSMNVRDINVSGPSGVFFINSG